MKRHNAIVKGWHSRKLANYATFDHIFKIGSLPLSWFFSRSFYPHILPTQISPYKLLEPKGLGGRQLLIAPKYNLYTKLLKRYLKFNEGKKIDAVTQKKLYSPKPKALFLAFTNHISKEGRIFRIEQIVQTLRAQAVIDDLVLFATPFSQKPRKSLKSLRTPYQYFNEKSAGQAAERASLLAAEWASLEDKSKYNLLNEYKGFTKEELWGKFKYSFDFYFSSEFLYVLCLYYHIFLEILEKEKIKVALVTGTSSIIERCLLAAAHVSGVPSVVLTHGLGLGVVDPELLESSVVGTFNGRLKKQIVGAGVAEEKVKIVGPAIYDEIVQHISPRKNGVDNILLATSPLIQAQSIDKEEYFNRFETMISSLQKNGSASITIKLHPRELFYKEYVKISQAKVGVTVYKGDISRKKFYKLIEESTVFIGFGSNAALEAMIIDRPVITIQIADRHVRGGWIDEIDAAIEARWNEDLSRVVKLAKDSEKIYGPRRQALVSELCGAVDGKASQRVANLLYEVADLKK